MPLTLQTEEHVFFVLEGTITFDVGSLNPRPYCVPARKWSTNVWRHQQAKLAAGYLRSGAIEPARHHAPISRLAFHEQCSHRSAVHELEDASLVFGRASDQNFDFSIPLPEIDRADD
jgi:hypothetical protein